MRWPTVCILLMVTLLVSCTPFGKEVKEDELMDEGGAEKLLDSETLGKLRAQRSIVEEGPVDFDSNDLDQNDDRYIGYCDDANILMWPGNSRKFWSYGYVFLIQPYLANCTMNYYYNTRNYPGDPFSRFGFTVRGVFESHGGSYTTCTDTDYILLNDTDGNAQYYCGAKSQIDWATPNSDFEFHFVTKPNSPRGKGFYVVIESFKVCGGAYTMDANGPSGTLLTPLYPKPYPGNVACTWYFAMPDPGMEVTVKVACGSFALQAPFNNGTNYCLDSITFLKEVPGNTTSYCSNTLANNKHMIYSIHEDLLVTFRSDSTIEDTGFNCTYEYIFLAE